MDSDPRQLLPRFVLVLARFFERGYLPFLLTALLITTAAYSLQSCERVRRTREHEVRRTLNSILKHRLEIRRDQEHAVILAAALRSPFVDRAFDCSESRHVREHPCATIRRIHGQHARIQEEVERVLSSPPVVDSRTDDRTDDPTPIESALRAIASGAATPIEELVEPCSTLTVGPEADPYSQALCDHHATPRRAPLLVPSLVADEPPRDRIVLAVRYSLIVEELVANFDDVAPQPSSRLRRTPPWAPEVANMYFVSVDGVLRSWRPGPPPTQDSLYADYGPLYLLRDRSYVAHFRDRERGARRTEYTSHPYLDLSGAGIVRTSCSPASVNGQLLGVLCVDYTLPIVPNAPSRGALADFGLVAVRRVGDSANFTMQPLGEDSPIQWTDIEHLRSEIEHQFHSTDARSAEGEELRGSFTEIISDPDHELYAIPLRRDGRTWYYLVLETKELGVSWQLYLFIASSLLLVVVAGATIGFRLRRTQAELEASMLRNLQVGVIQVERGEVVVAANDRAEELLKRRLPSFGEWGAPTVPYASLFEQVGIMEVGRSDDTRYEPISQKQVARQRTRGEPSRYYLRRVPQDASVREKDRWLEVHGSPFLETLGSSSQRGTFAVLRLPSPKLQNKLEREWRRMRGRG